MTTALDGTQANRHSGQPALSGDGRVVAFSSAASNLVPSDGNGASDVFVYDEATGDIERVSVATGGGEAEGSSSWPAISGDGRIVAFSSEAGNLVPQDRNDEHDIFVHDRTTGRTELISIANDGSRALGGSQTPSVSSDGRYVAFHFLNDVVVRDRVRGRMELASVANDGSPAECCSLNPAISADGRIVAFEAYAQLVPRDTNDVTDVYVRDLERGRTELVSVASDGGQANRESGSPSVSGDGVIVAFTSFADKLVPHDTNRAGDVFAHDRVSGRTERVSVASDGFQAVWGGHAPAVSGDGRLIAFASWADNLVFRDGNDAEDVFVHDRLAGRTELVSVARGGTSGNGWSTNPTASGDGRLVAFVSRAANLVPNDRNRRHDVLVARRLPSRRPRCTIIGTHGDDVLIGTGADDVICGRGGNDRLIGRGGEDLLRGGAGGDLLKGGAGADQLIGGPGGDELLGGAGGDAVFGGRGGDRLRGGAGDDKVEGGRGSDRLRGGPGDDRLSGGSGQDVCRGGLGTDRTSSCEQDPPRCFGMRPTIVGTGGPDVLTGTAGDDVIVGLDGLDEIRGGSGDDRICAGEDPVDTQGEWESVYGGPGDDRIKGGRGHDALYGGDGADIIFGGPNPSFAEEDRIQEAEYISGGNGNDTLIGGPGVDVVFGGAGADRLSSGDDRGAASYGGGHPDNYLYGGDGRDQLRGGSGIEHAQGGNGSDRLEGGPGDDHIHGACSYHGYGHPHDVPELGEEAPNPNCADTHGRDKLLGGGGSDWLDGGDGGDVLRGHDGDDRIAGGAGDDDLDGGPGRNRNHGGSGTDRCANPSRGAKAIACENSP